MNIYKVYVMNYGNLETYLVQSYDILTTLQNNSYGFIMNQIIKIEIVDSTEAPKQTF